MGLLWRYTTDWGMNRMIYYDKYIVGDVLRCVRKNNNMTQREMAEKLDVSYIHYSKIEQGERKLQIELMFKIIDMFDVDANLFLGKIKTGGGEELDTLAEGVMKLDDAGKRYILEVWKSVLLGYLKVRK